MTKLSTHVLDTTAGTPAAGVEITLLRLDPNDRMTTVATSVTNHDGRTDAPLLAGDSFTPGTYELRFAIGAYFARRGDATGFLDVVPVRFRADATSSIHVPLLVTPWSYTTYRGS